MIVSLLAIQLVPDYAIIASAVILAHWVWLFGLKKRDASLSAWQDHLPADAPIAGDTIEASRAADEEHVANSHFEQNPSVGNKDRSEEAFISAQPRPGASEYYEDSDKTAYHPVHMSPERTEKTAPVSTAATEPSAVDTATVDTAAVAAKYAGRDIMAVLEAAHSGELSSSMIEELTELSALTLATEEQFPYAIDFV